MIGILLGLGSAVAFGIDSIVTSWGVFRVSSDYGATISKSILNHQYESLSRPVLVGSGLLMAGMMLSISS